MSELFLKIVNMSISAGWLVLAVLLLRLLFKRAPKWVNVLLWGIVAARLICPFSFESALSLIPSAETISPAVMVDQAPSVQTGIPAINSAIEPVIGASSAPAPEAGASPLQIWIPVLSIIWAAGVAALVVYTAVSYWRLRRKVREAVILRDNIYQSEHIASPFVLGMIKPKIYLPYHVDGQELDHVVAHEQAHIRRKDNWWKPLGFLLLTIYWFDPLMWLAYALLCRDIELACDEKVIKELGGEQRADYTQALVACSVSRRVIAACPLAFGEVGVKERVKSVMNYKKPAFWVIVLAVAACAAVAVCFLTDPVKHDAPTYEGDAHFLYEKEGFLGAFTLTLFDDGTFSYYEGMASSHIGAGAWTQEGDIITLTDNEEIAGHTRVNHFRAEGDDLVFLAEDSSNFIYVDVRDGERFHRVSDAPEGRKLTLDDVIALSKKGDALSWDDFAEYAYYIETGGLYIRVYEIDKVYELRIGGDGPDRDPMYIFLTLSDDGDAGIDIRKGGVEAFIEAHSGALLKNAITSAILEQNKPSGPDGLFHCASFALLKQEGDPSASAQVTVYGIALYQAFGFSGGTFHEVAGIGGQVPVAITFEVADGEYRMKEYWTPRDGSYSAPDIRDKFPDDIEDEALHTQNYRRAQFQDCYDQAIRYGDVDTDDAVERLFEAIESSPAASSRPSDYIDAHPIEYRELTYYGKYTLRYVFSKFLEGGQTGLRGHLMRAVLDELAPEAQLKLEAETGQAYFDAWKAGAIRVSEQHDMEWMKENQPAMYLLLQMIEA